MCKPGAGRGREGASSFRACFSPWIQPCPDGLRPREASPAWVVTGFRTEQRRDPDSAGLYVTGKAMESARRSKVIGTVPCPKVRSVREAGASRVGGVAGGWRTGAAARWGGYARHSSRNCVATTCS